MRRLAPFTALALLAWASAAPAAAPPGPTWERCNWLIRQDGGVVVQPATGLRLVGTRDALAGAGSGVRLEAVHCERDSLVPDAWDDRVPRMLGVPLVIRGPGGMTTVEIRNAVFRVRFSDSVRVTPDLREASRKLVDRWQTRPNPVR